MTVDEHAADLSSQIAYHQRELEHFRQVGSILGIADKTHVLVVQLIASLHQELLSLPLPSSRSIAPQAHLLF